MLKQITQQEIKTVAGSCSGMFLLPSGVFDMYIFKNCPTNECYSCVCLETYPDNSIGLIYRPIMGDNWYLCDARQGDVDFAMAFYLRSNNK